MRLIAFPTDPSMIRDMLLHLGEPTAAAHRACPPPNRPWDLPDAWPGTANKGVRLSKKRKRVRLDFV
jgi:hypothetical protein